MEKEKRAGLRRLGSAMIKIQVKRYSWLKRGKRITVHMKSTISRLGQRWTSKMLVRLKPRMRPFRKDSLRLSGNLWLIDFFYRLLFELLWTSSPFSLRTISLHPFLFLAACVWVTLIYQLLSRTFSLKKKIDSIEFESLRWTHVRWPDSFHIECLKGDNSYPLSLPVERPRCSSEGYRPLPTVSLWLLCQACHRSARYLDRKEETVPVPKWFNSRIQTVLYVAIVWCWSEGD